MNNNDVIEINLIDLMYEVLKKFPLIILVALICAALGAGFGAMKAREYNGQISDDMPNMTPEEELAFEKLTEAQKTKVAAIDQQISENEKQIALQEKKIENTLIWNWNTPVAYRSTVKYLVVPTGDDATYNVLAILSAYQSGINAANFDKQLIDVLGLDVDVEAVRDLVWADISFQEELDGTPGTLSIQVRGKTEEDTKKMTKLARKYIDSLHSSFVDSIAKHDLKFISEDDTIEKLDWAENDKAACTLTISDKNRIIANLIEEKEKILFPNGREKKEEVKQDKKSLVDVKMIAIGGLVGAFATAMVLAICYVMDGLLHDASILATMTGAQCFCFEDKDSNKKTDVFRFLKKIKNKSNNVQTIEKAADMLVAYIEAISKQESKSSVCFVGSYISDIQKSVIADVEDRLKLKDIRVAISEKPLEDAASMTQLSNADLVIISEVEGRTRVDDIKAVINLCLKLSKPVESSFVLCNLSK